MLQEHYNEAALLKLSVEKTYKRRKKNILQAIFNGWQGNISLLQSLGSKSTHA